MKDYFSLNTSVTSEVFVDLQHNTTLMFITSWPHKKERFLFSKYTIFYGRNMNNTFYKDWHSFFFQIKKLFHYSNYQTPICLVGKTTRPFRYDLNEIPYDYTVEVRNRFQGLDLIDRGPENYGQRFVTLYRRQGSKLASRKRNEKKQNGFLSMLYK